GKNCPSTRDSCNRRYRSRSSLFGNGWFSIRVVHNMRFRARTVLAIALLACGCSNAPSGKQYELKGQILAIKPEQNEVLIKHEDIKGFMPAMTMPYKVQDSTLLAGKAPGDLVTATLFVGEVEA